MSIKFMREMLFFDLPTNSKLQMKEYRHFIRDIKKIGFYMLQESVYIKLNINPKDAFSSISKVKKVIPKEGNICILTITEKQFSSMEFLLGENYSDVINSNERTIIL